MIIDWYKENAIKIPNMEALVEVSTGEVLNYSQLDENAILFASNLQINFGLKKGDRVVVISPFSNDLFILLGAALKIGVVIVPINHRLDNYSINELIEKVNASLVIVSASIEHNISINTNKLFVLDLDVLYQRPDREFGDVAVTEDDELFIFFTSGSTGSQRGVRYTHKMLYWNMMNTKDSLSISSNDITISSLPPFHSGGWNILLTPVLMNGAKVILSAEKNYSLFFALVSKYQINKMVLIPTQLNLMYNTALETKNSISSLDSIIVGGESLSIPLIDKWHELGVSILQGYGLTEAGPSITSLSTRYVNHKKGSIGRPNKYMVFDILNQNGKSCKVEELGEIVLKGDVVSPGYICDIDKRTSKGWFYTGDLAYKDQEGFIFIKGRRDDMYISGGENIYPSEIEKVLSAIDEVDHACVVGYDNEKWGKVGVGFIVLNKRYSEITEELIKQKLLNKIAKFKIPHKFIFLDSLPLNQVGKVDKKELKNYLFSNETIL